jgi:tRNA pseudouridine synthase 10
MKKLNERLGNLLEVLERPICNHCLGRLFSQLLINMKNEEKGKTIRNCIAMLIDGKFIDYSKIDPNNFFKYRFRENKEFDKIKKKPVRCWVCDNIFEEFENLLKITRKKLEKIEFNNFLVGSRISDKIIKKEECLWEIIGIEHVESIKSEINREFGKKLREIFKKRVNYKRPDVVIILDFEKKDVEIQINSLYIFGYYKKLARGIPQCKWGTPGKYRTSVQQIIAKPIMKATKGKDNSFHGYGREDIDARCLDWRPFVIEIMEPKKRNIKLREIQRQINKSKKVKVKGLKFSNKTTVVRVKTERGDKVYRALVKLDRPISRSDLKKLKKLVGVIEQQTPLRVLHRRADLVRKRKVKSVSYRFINKKTFELKVKTSAGLYIKELISGDKGRTRPSVSELLNRRAVCKELDVVKIEKPKDL